MTTTGSKVCGACGTVGLEKKHTPGSLGIEILLWCCFFVPGIIYSLWRLMGRKVVCEACGSPNLIPVESPIGRKLLAETIEAAKKIQKKQGDIPIGSDKGGRNATDSSKQPMSIGKKLGLGCLGLLGIFVGIAIISTVIESVDSKSTAVPSSLNITVGGKRVNARFALVGHWRAKKNEFFNGEDNLFFSSKKITELGVRKNSLYLLSQRNPEALNFGTVTEFHPKNNKDPDDDNFTAGPYPYSISVDSKTNEISVVILDFGNNVWMKQDIHFKDNLKSYEATDYSSNGNAKDAVYTYIDAKTEP